ncbi:MAG: PqqD family protein [Desulfosporosinus sp.]|nr:PqqD family protein [Desulfosporosinus sp.]
MRNFIPVFDDKTFVREENEENLLLIPPGFGINESFVVNSVSKEILRCVDGKRTVYDVAQHIQNQYAGEISIDTVVTDVEFILKKLTGIGIIGWAKGAVEMYKGERVFKSNEYYVWRAGEGMFKDALEIIVSEKRFFSYTCPYSNIDDYSSGLVLRNRLFSFSEEFYFLFVKGMEKPKALISIIRNKSGRTSVATVGTFIIIEQLDDHLIKTFILKSIEDFYSLDNIEASVIRFFELDANETAQSSNLHNLLQNTGFQKEGVLKNEFGPGQNLIIWSAYPPIVQVG